MSSRLASVITRLQACEGAGVPWPDDLRADALNALVGIKELRDRNRERDRQLRLARLCLPTELGKAPWTAAGALLVELKALRRARRPDTDSELRACLRRAIDHGKVPESQKQLARIIATNDPDDWTF